MKFEICDVMMSISTEKETMRFCIYLLNHKSLDYKTRSTNRHDQGQCFYEISKD